ncbi:MAG: CPBP family intramembrane metalloprotease [Rhizobiales bacterium]|nr:CPBP family intramembrane metalloprotease [Hyphomicrobiales bacterium]NRB13746.1 CPBP family intramembrane metalloprotease [Hyphomicrobiales bacterium]
MRQAKNFLVLTFAINYAMALGFYLSGATYSGTTQLIMGVAYMLVPMMVVFYLGRKQKPTATLKAFKFFNGFNLWYLMVLLLPITVAFLALQIGSYMPGVSITNDLSGLFARYADLLTEAEIAEVKTQMANLPLSPILLASIQAVVLGATINALATFGEELGWRGYLLHSFRKLNFWRASLYIGIIWGVWHAPLILLGHNYPANPIIGVFMMVAFTTALSPIFNYLMIKTYSILAMSMLHGVLNASAGIAIFWLAGGTALTVGLAGVAGIIALWLVILAIYIYDRLIAKQNIMSHRISAHIWQSAHAQE